MEARLGAFLQKAVIATFGISYAIAEAERYHAGILEPVPRSPEIPNIDDLRDAHNEVTSLQSSEYPHKRLRSTVNSNGIADKDEQYSQYSETSARTETLDNVPVRSLEPDSESHLVDGLARVISVEEGGKDHLAILISRDMIFTYNEIKDTADKIAKKKIPIRIAERNASALKLELEEIEDTMDTPDDSEDRQHNLEDIQSRLLEIEERTSMLKLHLAPLESSLRESTNEFQSCLVEAFESAPQLETFLRQPQPNEVEGEEEEEVDEDEEQQRHYHHSEGGSTVISVPSASSDQLRQEAAIKDVQMTSWDLMEAHAAFDGRHEDYHQELANYHQLIAMGEINYSKTEFDLMNFEHVQGLTQRLRHAEAEHERAKLDAKALKISVDPETGCVFDDGYRESQEACLSAHVDRDRIEQWTSNILIDEDPMALREYRPIDFDPWEAVPVDIPDSVSCVDTEIYASHIKRWANHCNAVRREQPTNSEADNRWISERTPSNRRQSL